MRIIGIDFGQKRIGIAVSDPLKIIASPVKTLSRTTEEDDLKKIDEVIKSYEAATVVVGLPKNMDGTEGQSAALAKDFAQKIKDKSAVEIVFKDERMSSQSAERVLDEANMHWKKRKEVVDTIAAQIILQSYLDMCSRN